MNMKLGILLKDGKIVNHRSFIKVILNPIFRYFGFCIATLYDKKLKGICFIKCQKIKLDGILIIIMILTI